MIRRSPALTWYVILVCATVLLALVLPINPTVLRQFHITPLEYREAIVTILVPYVIIWFSAFFAFDKLSQYAEKLRKADEGPAFRQIARGLGVLAWGLALTTILSTVLGGIAGQHSAFQATRTIITNYATLLFPLVGFTLLGNGAHELMLNANARLNLNTTRLLFSLLALLGVLFTYFVLHTRFTGDNPYRLPLMLLLLTLVAPYLYTWYIGIIAAYELKKYSARVKGILYQRSLNTLSIGMTIVITASIFIQYVGSIIGSGKGLSFGYLLLIVYVLLFLEAAGYALIALGARQLKRIEEV